MNILIVIAARVITMIWR